LISRTFTEIHVEPGQTPITRTVRMREADGEYVVEARTEWPEEMGGNREWEVIKTCTDEARAARVFAAEIVTMSVNFQLS